MPVSRTRLVINDPDRSALLAWNYDGITIPGRSGVSRTECWYDEQYHGVYSLPPNAKPGHLPLPFGTVQVVSAPDRKVRETPLGPAKTTEALRDAIAKGYRDITIAPGTQWVEQTVRLPDWLILRSDGVTWRRRYTGSPDFNWAMFAPGSEVSVYGGTFVHERSDCQVFTSNTPVYPTGLVVADAVFKRCNFGFHLGEVFVRDCLFDYAGAVIAPSGLWARNRFSGTWIDPLTVGALENPKPTAVVDCTFDGTTRGIVFNAWADISDFLSVGNRFRNIDLVNGGGELLLVEGYGVFRRALLLHTAITNCEGAFPQFDHAADHVLLRDHAQDGGIGLLLWGDVKVANVTLQESKLTNGAGMLLGEKCTGFRGLDTQVMGWRPDRHTSHFNQTGPVDLGRSVACLSLGSGNVLESSCRIETLAGYVTSQGFARK